MINSSTSESLQVRSADSYRKAVAKQSPMLAPHAGCGAPRRCCPAATLGTVELKEVATPSGLSLIEMLYLRPYRAQLPNISLDNLMTAPARDAATARWMKLTAEQDMAHADMADAGVLKRIIWFSVRGTSVAMPEVARLPAFDAMVVGIAEEEEEQRQKETEVAAMKRHKSRRAEP